jgi:hypothetical protein
LRDAKVTVSLVAFSIDFQNLSPSLKLENLGHKKKVFCLLAKKINLKMLNFEKACSFLHDAKDNALKIVSLNPRKQKLLFNSGKFHRLISECMSDAFVDWIAKIELTLLL